MPEPSLEGPQELIMHISFHFQWHHVGSSTSAGHDLRGRTYILKTLNAQIRAPPTPELFYHPTTVEVPPIF